MNTSGLLVSVSLLLAITTEGCAHRCGVDGAATATTRLPDWVLRDPVERMAYMQRVRPGIVLASRASSVKASVRIPA